MPAQWKLAATKDKVGWRRLSGQSNGKSYTTCSLLPEARFPRMKGDFLHHLPASDELDVLRTCLQLYGRSQCDGHFEMSENSA